MFAAFQWTERFQLRPREQRTVAAVSLMLATLGAIAWWSGGGFRGEFVAWESPKSPDQIVSFTVDLNEADWPELTALPRIGETLAKRIVGSRNSLGPFRSVDQLQRVKGIGPRTVDLIRPYATVDSRPADSSATK